MNSGLALATYSETLSWEEQKEKGKGDSDKHVACAFPIVFHIVPIQQMNLFFCLYVPICSGFYLA